MRVAEGILSCFVIGELSLEAFCLVTWLARFLVRHLRLIVWVPPACLDLPRLEQPQRSKYEQRPSPREEQFQHKGIAIGTAG